MVWAGKASQEGPFKLRLGRTGVSPGEEVRGQPSRRGSSKALGRTKAR